MNEKQYVSLTAPWYIFQKEMAATVGKTPYVQVGKLIPDSKEGIYHLPIEVTSCEKQALALRSLLPRVVLFGNIKVLVDVLFETKEVSASTEPISSPDELMEIIKCALWCNPYFIGNISTVGKLVPMEQAIIGDVVIVIKPCVIQFYNDALSNLCNQYLEVASKVFEKVLKNAYEDGAFRVSITTYNEQCMKQYEILGGCCML